MITYTCSDIIHQAKIVGNVSNVNLSNFELCNSILNSEYQKLYDKIVLANGAQIKEEHFTTDQPYDIPEDCYHIIGVYSGKRLLTKSSVKQHIKGTYRIENNKIILESFGHSDDIYIKYSTLPKTLTAPDTPEEIKADVKEVGLVTDKGFYFKDSNDVELYYDFSAQESVEKTFKAASNRFLDSTLEITDVITYNGTDVTYIFEREDVDITSVKISDPYVIVNYSDNRSFIFYGFEGADQLNWNEAKGKETYGEVLGFTTNDITGKGCIWKDEEGDIYYTSFTPDTLLNYPSNTFFQLLIYKLAAALTALNGVQNQYLIEIQIPEAQVAFEEHLAKDNLSVIRMNNDLIR